MHTYSPDDTSEVQKYTDSSFQAIPAILDSGCVAFDFETSGLSPYKGCEIVSLALANRKQSWFFNFNRSFSPYIAEERVNEFLREIFCTQEMLWIAHNAKFDLHWLLARGIEPLGKIYCTETFARVEFNDHFTYKLEACAKRIGLDKSDAVVEYCTQNKLWHWEQIPGKKARRKAFHFYEVPPSVLGPYNIRDAEVSLALHFTQQETFAQWNEGMRPIRDIVALEIATTKNLTDMERVGIRLSADYCRAAIKHNEERIQKAKSAYTELTRMDFCDSPRTHGEAFSKFYLQCGKTEKGRDSFSEDVLEKIDHPLPKIILEYRDALKRNNTFFNNFLFFVAEDGRIHPNFRQSGCTTGRFSCADPNLQQVPNPDKDKDAFPVRKAFVASPGFKLLSLDWKQIEYRVMLDYAGCMPVIEKIKSGLDMHTATAETLGISRSHAKTLNFALIYGAGAEKLAAQLGCSVIEAKRLKQRYFEGMPEVQGFLYGGRGHFGVVRIAETRGYVINRFGRRYRCANKEFAYKLPNHLIQGTCSDVMRVALDGCMRFIEKHEAQSKLLLSIHDEFVFELAQGEEWLIKEFARIMRSAYPHKHLPLDVSAEVGETLYDMEEVEC